MVSSKGGWSAPCDGCCSANFSAGVLYPVTLLNPLLTPSDNSVLPIALPAPCAAFERPVTIICSAAFSAAVFAPSSIVLAASVLPTEPTALPMASLAPVPPIKPAVAALIKPALAGFLPAKPAPAAPAMPAAAICAGKLMPPVRMAIPTGSATLAISPSVLWLRFSLATTL